MGDWEMIRALGGGVRRGLYRQRILHLFGSVALGTLSLPLVARAQTTLPDINVIATSPASRPSTKPPARPAPAQPTRTVQQPSATAPAGTGGTPNGATTVAAPNANGGTIDRDKVPSNTEVLTSADFDHTRSLSLLD